MRHLTKRDKYSKIAFYIFVAILIIAVGIHLYGKYNEAKQAREAMAKSDGLFTAHFIDVGQGDATLLCSPDGRNMLIDCGPTSSADYLVKYLSDCDVKSLEYLILTHPHEDHYGGAFRVIESFPVENFIVHEDFADNYPCNKLIYEMSNDSFDTETQIIETQKGQSFEFADCASFEIISPDETDPDDLNDSSLCFIVEFGDTAFMFTGDAEKGSEKDILNAGYDIDSDVFQAGHHGSRSSNTQAFVEALSPEYVVISCKESNRYGHPHKEALEVFEENNVIVLRTDILGSIVISSDGENVEYMENFYESVAK